MQRRLSDNDAHELLGEAARVIANGKGETVHAETALRSAEMVISVLQLGLLAASEKSADEITSPPPPSRP